MEQLTFAVRGISLNGQNESLIPRNHDLHCEICRAIEECNHCDHCNGRHVDICLACKLEVQFETQVKQWEEMVYRATTISTLPHYPPYQNDGSFFNYEGHISYNDEAYEEKTFLLEEIDMLFSILFDEYRDGFHKAAAVSIFKIENCLNNMHICPALRANLIAVLTTIKNQACL